ncbi:flagellar motor protein [Thermotalea metallivorans]|uniref:Chemotaxis protein PomA n=1 Tax=Thermotalea metallivorans TaxID=520762 RepID=A0A140L5C9_9FIRM|nr:flagellar motor protein [Thermotalea metallivorans]KXG75754.1 Chemotaxis protein PomA [Thermotalea metallivorans]
MDLATLIGILLGFGFMVWGIFLGGSILSFWDVPSIVIVLGGTVAGTLVAHPLKKVAQSITIVRKAFSSKDLAPGDTIGRIIELANTARREGLLALEEAAENIDDEFLQKGVMLIVDGTDPELVRNILETELAFLEERHGSGRSLFETMGSLAPAFGMIGTLIGLVNMLKKLDDPKAVGPSMAVALITTFYGSVLANLLFIPIATKLKIRSKEEILIKEIMVEGLLSIQAGENPRIIEEKLKAFLPPTMRKSLHNSKGEGAEV